MQLVLLGPMQDLHDMSQAKHDPLFSKKPSLHSHCFDETNEAFWMQSSHSEAIEHDSQRLGHLIQLEGFDLAYPALH
jgi:hypothetical protein